MTSTSRATGPPRGTKRRTAALWVAAVGACAVCCAGPLLAVLAAVGVTAGVAAVAVPGLAVVAAAAVAGLWLVRRRARDRCAAPSGPVELDAPVVHSSQDTKAPW